MHFPDASRRTKLTSSEAPLYRAVDDFICAGILSPFFSNLPVALSAKFIDLGKHSGQQLFRRDVTDAGPLKVPNLAALPVDLAAHVFDFRADG